MYLDFLDEQILVEAVEAIGAGIGQSNLRRHPLVTFLLFSPITLFCLV